MRQDLAAIQAGTISATLPVLMRQFLSGGDDPASELPLAQLRVCGVLHDGPQAMSALSRELRVSLSAITQIANRLVRARLVCRVPLGDDRRVRYLQLTPRGAEIMRVREEARRKRVLAVLERMSPEAGRHVAEAFELLKEACRAAGKDRVDRGVAPPRCL